MQHTIINQKRIHEPNFIAVKVTCPACIQNIQEECKICGKFKSITFSMKPFKNTNVDKQYVTSYPLTDFVNWILSLENDTVAFSHFGGRFDMVLVFKMLFLRGLTPDMIKKGNKLYEMKVKNKSSTIIFRDSFNLLPMPLASLVPAFALNVQDKPFFPHMSNRPENYGKQIFPTKEDYLAEGMMKEKRNQFDQWYNENKNKPFILEEQLASYCTNDVEILMAALLTFQKEFKTVSNGLDVLREAMTIASACMKHFRLNHLKPLHLAIVPEKGYDNVDNQSMIALKFLKWYGEKYNVIVQTSHSKNGEKRIGKYRLDGWIEEEKLGIEVNGCCWHGCNKCYTDKNMILPNGRTVLKQQELDKNRLKFIKDLGVNVKVFWECEIKKMLSKDRDMRKMFKAYLDDGPINIRAAFYGGRTGPLKLYHHVKPGQKISYYDVTSLYPFINVTTRYPIGHPQIHVINNDVLWTKPEDNPYKLAILKVFVIPPRNIDIPVLPMKIDDDDQRLLFPLCYTCAKNFPLGDVKENYSCPHSDNQRGWISTCTSIELNEALKEGYIVNKVYRVLEYLKYDDQLFQPYISEFMAQKIHASGFDQSIKGDNEKEEKFVKECYKSLE
jgi:G:T-mismatch repair DNA endonuclease (very short patch repair protein)